MSNPIQSATGNVELVPGIVQAFGYSYDPYFDRYKTLWQTLAQRHYPSGPEPADCSFYAEDIGAHMAARAILYGGTCAGQAAIGSVQRQGAIAGMASQTTITVTDILAKGTNAIPIVGSLVSIFDSVFGAITAHHAQAVQTEQATICAAIQAFNQVCPQIDAQVRSGQITATQGIDAMTQAVTQVKAMLAPISGVGSSGHPCNAGCCYQAVLDCHLDFAGVYYMDISPISHAAVNPGTYAPAAPASVGAAIADVLFPPSGSPIVPRRISGTSLFLLLLMVFGIIWYAGIK